MADILETENYRLYEPLSINYNSKNKSSYSEEVRKTFSHQLGGNVNPYPMPILFPIVHDNFVIILDEELSFNRYRKKTFNSALYDNFKGLNKGQYQRYCRIYEYNCLKVGLKQGVWNNDKAEQLFGIPAEPGDFFANGSPGWKLIAFQHYLQDVYAMEKEWNIIRVSIYDNILLDGQLQPLGKLLETGQEKNNKSIFNFLKHKMNLPNQ
ncbi:MAG: DUF7255 family protein [Cyclobacteriaceae bacterium]